MWGRLTLRDRWLLAMLAEHTVLTTPQLLALGWAPAARRVQRRALELHRAGFLDRFRPFVARGLGSAPWHWIRGPRGAAALAAQHGLTIAQIGYRGRARTGAIADRSTLAHDLAVHDLVTTLAATPGIELTQWWSPARCARAFGTHTRPDAYLCLTTRRPDATSSTAHGSGGGAVSGWWEAFLEYDTGSETLARLAGKLRGYHDLAAATGLITPVAVFTARPGREPTARAALTDTLAALPRPGLVPVYTAAPTTTPPTDRDPTSAAGPAGPATAAVGDAVWSPVLPPGHTPTRVAIAELAARQPLTARPADPRPGPSRDTSALPPPPPSPPPPLPAVTLSPRPRRSGTRSGAQ